MYTVESDKIKIEKTSNSRLGTYDIKTSKFGSQLSDHMLMVDFKEGHWQDARIIPYGNLSMDPASCVFHYGQALFEGMKAFKSKDGQVRLFRPEDNARRLNLSAKRLCMPELPEDIFLDGLYELIRLDSAWVPDEEGYSLYIRPYMFADEAFLGVRPSEEYKFMIITAPVPGYYPEPLKVRIETKYSRAAFGGTGFAKAAGNYAAALYPTMLAAKDGYQQLIWTDAKEHKYIEEAGTMNIMFVIGDKLVTPSLESETILAGITRDSVLTVARDWGIEVEERKVSVDELAAAASDGSLKDVFGTGTAASITFIDSIAYGEQVFQLPPVPERDLSNRIKKYLDDLKYGHVEDPYGWVKDI